MTSIDGLDRLKSQLLTSGIQQENSALFQVINQLIDYLRQTIDATNQALSGSGGGGLSGASYLTKNLEVATLPGSKQMIAGSGIQFNDAGNRRVISAAIPFVIDGEQGEEGVPGPPGRIGIDGLPGVAGPPGADGASM